MLSADIDVGSRSFGNPVYAEATILNKTHHVETDYVFLRWEDIVTDSWIRNPVTLCAKAIGTYHDFIVHSDVPHVRKLGRGPLITFFYPLVLTALLSLSLFLVGFFGAIAFVPWWAAILIGTALAVLVAPRLLQLIHTPWLVRFLIFNNQIARDGLPPELEQRLAAFADLIAAPADGYDEVLLVTHSNGSILAIPLLDRLRARWHGRAPANLTVVTLGQCIPMLALRRDATALVAQLRRLADFDLRWIDIGSPPDGAAYHGVDPLLLCSPAHRAQIELLSPRFHLFYDPATYHKGLRHKYAIHFDYLRTGDRVSPIDLPSLVVGNRLIGESVAAFRAF